MPELSTLHPELRLRVPDKTSEVYSDALRWAIDYICVKTSMWRVITDLVTKPGIDLYDVDTPNSSAIHSNLYIIQKAKTDDNGRKGSDRLIKRPTNGFKITSGASSDWLQAFRTADQTEVQVSPVPSEGGVTLELHTAVKPISSATSIDNAKFFDEYKDTVVYGAMYRLHQLNDNIKSAEYNFQKFKEGVSSIHIDVLKENADTPIRANTRW